MLGIAVSSRPTLNVTHGHTVLQARASVTMFVSDSSGREDTAFTLEFVSVEFLMQRMRFLLGVLCSVQKPMSCLTLRRRATVSVATSAVQGEAYIPAAHIIAAA